MAVATLAVLATLLATALGYATSYYGERYALLGGASWLSVHSRTVGRVLSCGAVVALL